VVASAHRVRIRHFDRCLWRDLPWGGSDRSEGAWMACGYRCQPFRSEFASWNCVVRARRLGYSFREGQRSGVDSAICAVPAWGHSYSVESFRIVLKFHCHGRSFLCWAAQAVRSGVRNIPISPPTACGTVAFRDAFLSSRRNAFSFAWCLCDLERFLSAAAEYPSLLESFVPDTLPAVHYQSPLSLCPSSIPGCRSLSARLVHEK